MANPIDRDLMASECITSRRTEADRQYLLWRQASRAHGDEWAWARMGVRPASMSKPSI